MLDLDEVKAALDQIGELAGTSSSTAASSAFATLRPLLWMMAANICEVQETVESWIEAEDDPNE